MCLRGHHRICLGIGLLHLVIVSITLESCVIGVLTVYNDLRSSDHQCCVLARRKLTYFTSSKTFATSASEPKSSFKIAGGFARVKPVPTTSQPCLWNAFTTCRPSRPVAPVIRALFAMISWCCAVVQICRELRRSAKWRLVDTFSFTFTWQSGYQFIGSFITVFADLFFTMDYERPCAMKKNISCEKVGFQRFPSTPKHTWSGHGYSFQLAKTQSRTNPH